MGKVYFVRHGQTYWNVENKICGATDIALTPEGHEQVFFASTFCRLLQNKNVGYCKTVLQIVAPTFCRLLQRIMPAG